MQRPVQPAIAAAVEPVTSSPKSDPANGRDPAAEVRRETTAGSTTVTYAYDGLGKRQETIGEAPPPRSPCGLAQTTLPAGNGYLESRVYDRAGRLTEVKNERSATVLSHFVSTLDPVGNPTQVVRTGSLAETQTYTYDASDRITGVCFQAGTCPGASDPFIRWSYDKVGNRLSEQRPSGVSTAYTHDARDRLLSAGSTSFAYDQNGNQTQKGTRTFAYDLANRLKTTTQGSSTTTYSYDGEGKRLQASTGSSNSSKTNFLWDVSFGLPQIARENSGNGSLQRRYVYGERRISLANSSATTYYHYDPLGSVANMSSSSGSTLWTYSYEPFGTTRVETSNSGPTNFMKFTGEYLDPSGLYHLRARQYDATVGRFLAVDPIEQDVRSPYASAYSYATCRPTVLVDPTGMLSWRPGETSEGMAALATSLAQSRTVSLPRWSGTIETCWFSATVTLGLLDPGKNLIVSTIVPNYSKAADRVIGSVTLRKTGRRSAEPHEFEIRRTPRNLRNDVWREIGGDVPSVRVLYFGPKLQNQIDPNDRRTSARLLVVVRHGPTKRCDYRGQFIARP